MKWFENLKIVSAGMLAASLISFIVSLGNPVDYGNGLGGGAVGLLASAYLLFYVLAAPLNEVLHRLFPPMALAVVLGALWLSGGVEIPEFVFKGTYCAIVLSVFFRLRM